MKTEALSREQKTNNTSAGEGVQIGLVTVKTVMELMATQADDLDIMTSQRPPSTPPQTMPTTTHSGTGVARIADDTLTDHLYE